MILTTIPGILIGCANAGIKQFERNDVVVMKLAKLSSVAAVFTTNAFCAAPVVLAKKHLSLNAPRYFLINSGNANAGMGDAGLQATLSCCQALASAEDCKPSEVLPFSTGVIGERLPSEKIRDVIPEAILKLSNSNWADAAEAIMTTDTVPKGVTRTTEINGHPVNITGIAKGSGMICPNMATMLSFIATDAVIEKAVLQSCLEQALPSSFNAITVDGDTSTNDACVLVATNHSNVTIDDQNIDQFQRVLTEVCVVLAQSIIRDAEGATKFVTIQIEQAMTEPEARNVAYTIAHSPLVKTALFASDPNWGRILAAIGRTELENFDVSRVDISIGEVCVVSQGCITPDYSETHARKVMSKEAVTIGVVLGRGQKNSTIWTSDLSYEYIKINAEYRT